MAEIIKECALCIQSMVRFIYKNGIISVYGHKDMIQCEPEFFFSCFKEYEASERTDNYTEIFHDEDGIRWFTLIRNEVKE